MKVLALLNVSNVDDLSCDSGVIFQSILTREFYRSGIEYVLIGPDIAAFHALDFPLGRKAFLQMGTNRYDSRFTFDWEGLKQLIAHEMPDAIFNNQIELTSAIRALLVTLGANNTPLVAYCHYPALWGIKDGGVPVLDESLNTAGLGLPIVFDILNAACLADVFIIQSEFGKNLVLAAAAFHRVTLKQPPIVLPPPYDPRLYRETLGLPPCNRRLVYNHRLYASYGTEAFVSLVEGLSNVECRIFDPMPNRSAKRHSLSPSPMEFRATLKKMPYTELVDGNISREKYGALLQEARVGMGALRRACVWSMAAVDCMGLGIPVVAPHYAAYPEFIPQQLLFTDLDQAKDLIGRLLEDDHFWLSSTHACHAMVKQLAPSHIAQRLQQLFALPDMLNARALHGLRCEKTPLTLFSTQ
jgi:hypothetical protein